MEVAVLAQEEMDAVSGGIGIPGALIGGVTSGISYWAGSSSPNWPGLTTAIGTGALGGAIGGVIGNGLGLAGGLYSGEVSSWY